VEVLKHLAFKKAEGSKMLEECKQISVLTPGFRTGHVQAYIAKTTIVTSHHLLPSFAIVLETNPQEHLKVPDLSQYNLKMIRNESLFCFLPVHTSEGPDSPDVKGAWYPFAQDCRI